MYLESILDNLIQTPKSSAYCLLYGIEYGELPNKLLNFWNHEWNILYSKLKSFDHLCVQVATASHELTK